MKTNVSAMSIRTFREIKDSLAKQEWSVYQVILASPGLTRKEISRKVGIETSSISGRVNSLVEKGLVDDVHGGEKCSISGRSAGRLYSKIRVSKRTAA